MTPAAVLIFLAFALAFAAMYIEDKTPKQALWSVAGEALKGMRRLRVPLPALETMLEKGASRRVSYSPYKRIRKDARHLPQLLHIPTSDGSGEATHPDVLRVPEGWGAHGWKWLMSATPYPSGNDFFENPEFYVSFDGVRWSSPAEGSNPLARVPAEIWRRDLKKEYHSDTSLLLRGGTLRLYYRWSGVALDGTVENRVYVIASEDGLNWSERALLLEEKRPAALCRGFLSPSVLFMDGEYVMWTVEYDEGERAVTRRTSADGLLWSAPLKALALAPLDMPPPWHLDVVPCEGGLLTAMTAAKDRGFGASLYCGFSSDGGRVWNITDKLVEPGYFFEGQRIYRSSLVSMGGSDYSLFYSALSLNGTWNIARTELKNIKLPNRGAARRTTRKGASPP
ncbi:hypothetical protein FACS1894216_13230 [Synergistales bacterium]|nr:hypothetical protein FACS1894216_13230 [Synergistales bacterium]